jgi:hypothetical protein
MGLTAGLDVFMKRKIFPPGVETRTIQPIARHAKPEIVVVVVAVVVVVVTMCLLIHKRRKELLGLSRPTCKHHLRSGGK